MTHFSQKKYPKKKLFIPNKPRLRAVLGQGLKKEVGPDLPYQNEFSVSE